MLEHTNLREYCKTGMRTKQEKFIMHFLNMTDEKENLILNQVCQQLMTCLFLAMETATQFADSNLKSSYWFNVMEFMSSSSFSSLVDILPQGMRDRQFLAVINNALVKHFEVIIQRCLISAMKTPSISCYSTRNIYSEVHRFVGWAIFSRRKILKGIIMNSKTKQSKELALEELKAFALLCTQEEVVKKDI